MAIVAGMEQGAATPERHQPHVAPTAMVELEMVRGVVAQEIAARLPPRRAPWQTALVGALIAGLIALAGIAYSTLRSDMTALHTEISAAETRLRNEISAVETRLRSELRSEIGALRGEMQAGFAQVNATLLDHTDRLARLETAVGLPRADG